MNNATSGEVVLSYIKKVTKQAMCNKQAALLHSLGYIVLQVPALGLPMIDCNM